jgi:hypothetical protein
VDVLVSTGRDQPAGVNARTLPLVTGTATARNVTSRRVSGSRSRIDTGPRNQACRFGGARLAREQRQHRRDVVGPRHAERARQIVYA